MPYPAYKTKPGTHCAAGLFYCDIAKHRRMAAGALSGLQNPEIDHCTVGLISAAPSGIIAGWRLAPYPAYKSPKTTTEP